MQDGPSVGETCELYLHSSSTEKGTKNPLLRFFRKIKKPSNAEPDIVRSKGKINIWRLVAIAFVFTCSGPFGVEAVFRAGGPALGLFGLLVTPILFVMPQIVMVAELATMIKSNKGYVEWVNRALGSYFGFINAFSTLAANLVNMSVYCTLLSSYIIACNVVPWSKSNDFPLKYAIRFVGNFLATLLSLLPSSRVAEISTIIGSVVMAPFLIGFFATLPNINPAAQWLVMEPPSQYFAVRNQANRSDSIGQNTKFFVDENPSPKNHKEGFLNSTKPQGLMSKNMSVDWPLWGSTLCWLYTGWNSLGNLAAEVSSASVYTYGMIIAMVLDITAYFIAVTAALSVPSAKVMKMSNLAHPWEDGYLVPAFDAILPGWQLGSVVAMVSALSIFGIIINSITCYARAAAGMAELGWFPKKLARTYNFIPYNAIGLFFFLTAALSCFDFDILIQFNFVLAAQGYILTFIAFLRLKYIEKQTPRPYVVPGGLFGAWLTTVVKMLLMLFVMVTIFVQRKHVLLFYVGFNVFLSLVYSLIA